ncbi:DUF6941 family protein [Xanthomonas campestris]|uniref:DUF6941 family protein n=1 Tax=Xanthomonas campestris TaxID=339 RepID=UPI000E1F6CC2|nr:hypothetical protein [Xanthomonas campestris]
MIGRYLSGFFCDDIRHEIDGKITLVGCYGPEMQVSGFPVVLNKLCAHVTISTPGSNPFPELRVAVLKDDDVLAEGVVSSEMANSMRELAEKSAEDAGSGSIKVNVDFSMAPLTIDKACVLRVRAYCQDETIKGLALRVSAPDKLPTFTVTAGSGQVGVI